MECIDFSDSDIALKKQQTRDTGTDVNNCIRHLMHHWILLCIHSVLMWPAPQFIQDFMYVRTDLHTEPQLFLIEGVVVCDRRRLSSSKPKIWFDWSLYQTSLSMINCPCVVVVLVSHILYKCWQISDQHCNCSVLSLGSRTRCESHCNSELPQSWKTQAELLRFQLPMIAFFTV